VNMGTSPAQTEATFENGFTQQDCSGGSLIYAVRCTPGQAITPGTYGYAVADSGNATANFGFDINVSGEYDVFEWHGTVDGETLDPNVTYTVLDNGGQQVTQVNQGANAGKWNQLGTFFFSAGNSYYVEISAEGITNGNKVVADAIKVSPVSTTEPPTQPPGGGSKAIIMKVGH